MPFARSKKRLITYFLVVHAVSKYLWKPIAHAFGTRCRASNFDQVWVWINMSLPHGKHMYSIGLEAMDLFVYLANKKCSFDI